MDLKKLTESLVEQRATVPDIAAQVGDVEEHQEGAGYDLRPGDKRFSEAFLGIDDDGPNGAERPRYVDLTVAPGTDMKLSELENLFGAWKQLPARRRGKAPPARFMYDRPQFPFLGVVHAYASSRPDDPAARLERILIRREERID